MESGQIQCGVLTVSDTRTRTTDESGTWIASALRDAGHEVAEQGLVPDVAEAIEDQLRSWLTSTHLHVIITTGGTGIGRRDTTADVVRRLLDVELEGFGELFRRLSWEEIGPAAMLSRAVGGLVAGPDPDSRGCFLFALPGSPHAVQLALDTLLLPELAHLVWERTR